MVVCTVGSSVDTRGDGMAIPCSTWYRLLQLSFLPYVDTSSATPFGCAPASEALNFYVAWYDVSSILLHVLGY